MEYNIYLRDLSFRELDIRRLEQRTESGFFVLLLDVVSSSDELAGNETTGHGTAAGQSLEGILNEVTVFVFV